MLQSFTVYVTRWLTCSCWIRHSTSTRQTDGHIRASRTHCRYVAPPRLLACTYTHFQWYVLDWLVRHASSAFGSGFKPSTDSSALMSQARQRKRATAPVPALSFYAASPAVALLPLDAENPSSIAEPPSSEPDATASAPVALKTYASRRRRDQEASTCPSLSSEASLARPAGHLSAATLIKAGKRRRLEDAHCDDESIPPVLQDILWSSTSAPPLERTQVHRMPLRSRRSVRMSC
jgi:hypothetical protein